MGISSRKFSWSGAKLLLDLGTNSAGSGSGTHTSKFKVDNTGLATIAPVIPLTDNSQTLATTAFVKGNKATPFTTITGTTQQAVVNNKYLSDNVALVVITMPTEANSAVGDQVLVRGRGTGLWQVKFNTGQIGHGASDTTSGGTITAQSRYDTLALEKIAANEWSIIGNRGTLTIA